MLRGGVELLDLTKLFKKQIMISFKEQSRDIMNVIITIDMRFIYDTNQNNQFDQTYVYMGGG